MANERFECDLCALGRDCPEHDGPLPIGSMLSELWAKCDQFDLDEDARADKPWPESEDCTHCPGRVDGPHKFGCAVGGARQVKISVNLDD